MEHILSVIDSALGLLILVMLLVPGPNFIKGISIPLLWLYTLILWIGDYPDLREAVIAIWGWI